MNTQTQEVLKIDLENLIDRFNEGWHEGIEIDASDIMLLSNLREFLEQPAQEPVAWTDEYKNFLEWDKESLCDKAVCKDHEAIPLYTYPAPACKCEECGMKYCECGERK